ncbi:unnamed protein product [Leuciscus chuanchicus]
MTSAVQHHQQCGVLHKQKDQWLHTLLIRHQGPIRKHCQGEGPHPGPSRCHTCCPTHGAHTEITGMNDEPLAFKLQGQNIHSQPTCHLNNAELEGKGRKKQVLEPKWIPLDKIRPRVLLSKPAKDRGAPPLWTDSRGYEKQHLLSSFQAPFRNKHPSCYLHPCAGVDRDRYISG